MHKLWNGESSRCRRFVLLEVVSFQEVTRLCTPTCRDVTDDVASQACFFFWYCSGSTDRGGCSYKDHMPLRFVARFSFQSSTLLPPPPLCRVVPGTKSREVVLPLHDIPLMLLGWIGSNNETGRRCWLIPKVARSCGIFVGRQQRYFVAINCEHICLVPFARNRGIFRGSVAFW